MTVRELIAKLQRCNPNAIVVGYDDLQEQDFIVERIEEIPCVPNPEEDEDYEEVVRYCGGFCIVEEECIGKPIVYLS
jgi:hypothetical protein